LKKFSVLNLQCDVNSETFLENGCLLGVSPCRLVSGSRHEFNAFVLMAKRTNLRSKSQSKVKNETECTLY